jgi:membrane protein YqaA with SNARE-associated domain
VRDAVAALLIAYPVFLLLSRYVGRLLQREPDKRGSKVRKWLTYVTLFVAALVILGDLTFLVARLLSGELPPRFLARVVVVGAIAGYVFGHYLSDLRREEDERGEGPARGPGAATRVAAAVVILALMVGLYAAGSPRRARQEVIDQRRVNDLQQISRAIESYYGERRALPRSLEDALLLPGVIVESVQDPLTRQPYGYAAIDSSSYELCATFAAADTAPDQPYARPVSVSRFWRHPAGRHCYRLEIPREIRGAKRP